MWQKAEAVNMWLVKRPQLALTPPKKRAEKDGAADDPRGDPPLARQLPQNPGRRPHRQKSWRCTMKRIDVMALNSVITNAGAMVALQSLNKTNDMMDVTQKRISTGYRVADSKDDGAAFAVAQKVRGDVAGLTSANEQLGGATGLLDTTLTGLKSISETLSNVKSVMTKLADDKIVGEERKNYEAQYTQLRQQVGSFVNDSSYNGSSLLGRSVTADGYTTPADPTDPAATEAAGGTSFKVVRSEKLATYELKGQDLGSFDLAAVESAAGPPAVTGVYNPAVADTPALQAAAWKTALNGTGAGQFASVEKKVNDALNLYGNDSKAISNQVSYNKSKMEALETGLGALIDADLAKESARMQSLTIRQQLGTTSLSTANQAPSSLLSLFR
jgi:flagellin